MKAISIEDGSRSSRSGVLVRGRKSERLRGKWVSKQPGNKPDQPIMIDESEMDESPPVQGMVAIRTSETVDHVGHCAQPPAANTIMADIASAFPNVMEAGVDLPSETTQPVELAIGDNNLKCIRSAEKQNERKAADIGQPKKTAGKLMGKNTAEVEKDDNNLQGMKAAEKEKDTIPAELGHHKKDAGKPMEKNTVEVANVANTEHMQQDSDDDFDNPPWKKAKTVHAEVVSVK